ncbi:hypothetical protein [Vibrio parahaemolyticus]|uniref:hypothetical protein n=1 Tax=Vibrio parahaemolyticus TaxID=670 RepID=UPI0015DE29E1|nr:hypothetical protein [Vibrio parahaemolyticus]
MTVLNPSDATKGKTSLGVDWEVSSPPQPNSEALNIVAIKQRENNNDFIVC